MKTHQIFVVALSVMPVVFAGACGDRSFGTTNQNQNQNYNNGDPEDGGTTPPDGGELVADVVGWWSGAFEHAGFVDEAHVDPAGLDSCSPYLYPTAGHENWWVAGPEPAGLSLYPLIDGWEKIGLIRASGAITAPGEYGHMGAYAREFSISDSELLVCPTFERLRHCVIPRSGDLCTAPAVFYSVSREVRTTEIWPPPGFDGVYYEIWITHDENVADGQTDLFLRFNLPHPSGQAGWEMFELSEVAEIEMREDRLWFFFEQIHYSPLPEGWVMRDSSDGSLRVSIRGLAPNDATLHIWGEFPVDETLIVD